MALLQRIDKLERTRQRASAGIVILRQDEQGRSINDVTGDVIDREAYYRQHAGSLLIEI